MRLGLPVRMPVVSDSASGPSPQRQRVGLDCMLQDTPSRTPLPPQSRATLLRCSIKKLQSCLCNCSIQRILCAHAERCVSLCIGEANAFLTGLPDVPGYKAEPRPCRQSRERRGFGCGHPDLLSQGPRTRAAAGRAAAGDDWHLCTAQVRDRDLYLRRDRKAWPVRRTRAARDKSRPTSTTQRLIWQLQILH